MPPLSHRTPSEVFLHVERKLRAEGATFLDIDRRVAAELDVSADDYFAYHRVRQAVERYALTHLAPGGSGSVDPSSVPDPHDSCRARQEQPDHDLGLAP